MISSEDIPEDIQMEIRALKAQLRELREARDALTTRCRGLKRINLTAIEMEENSRLKMERDRAAFAAKDKEEELKELISSCKKRDKELGDSIWNPNRLRKPAIRSKIYGHGADISLSSDE